MWKYSDDNTAAIITAQKHIDSCRKGRKVKLPKTAVLFFMYSGVEYTISKFDTELITETLPTFLHSRPVYKIKNSDVCFLHGGWGAPMAADTIETLAVLGVKNVISVGMFGAFSENVNSGDIIIPNIALSEEGTSRHYYEKDDIFEPSTKLHSLALNTIKGAKSLPIVSTDAVYKQTFYKENLWRGKNAVGVDMETSALFSVGKHLGIDVVSILIASDKHPINENDCSWKWTMTQTTRYKFFNDCINFSLQIK